MTRTINCGHCRGTHPDIATIKACATGNLFPCHWAVEKFVGSPDERWLQVVDCGADAIATERGWTCAAGHEHVNIETRHAERWDYVEDFGEAMNLARAGVEPLTMSGHLVTGPASFAPTGRF